MKNYRLIFSLLVFLPLTVLANPNMLTGLEWLWIGAVVILGLFCLALVCSIVAYKKAKKPETKFWIMLVLLTPSVLVGIMLIMMTINVSGGEIPPPGSIRVMSLTMFIPAMVSLIIPAVIFYKYNSRTKIRITRR